MVDKKISSLQFINYDVAGGKIRFSAEHVIKHTKVPPDPGNTPNILGWSGPARSGTSALLFLLASHPDIDRAYFQPQKTLMRKGGPDFVLSAQDNLVCMKEVFGSLYPEENYDPIHLLLEAGVPPEKITWIILLRNPVQTFRSWHRRSPLATPESLCASQTHAIMLFNKYKFSRVRIVPFVYELFEDQEEGALKALLEHVGLSFKGLSLDFDFEAIDQKLVKGQIADRLYFESNIESILSLKRFIYNRNNYSSPKRLLDEVSKLCSKDYQKFCREVQGEFGDFKGVSLDDDLAHNLELSLVNVTN